MGLNIKNQEVEDLARQVAAAAGVTKTEAIRIALAEKRDRLGLPSKEQRWRQLESKLTGLLNGQKVEPVTKTEWDSLND